MPRGRRMSAECTMATWSAKYCRSWLLLRRKVLLSDDEQHAPQSTRHRTASGDEAVEHRDLPAARRAAGEEDLEVGVEETTSLGEDRRGVQVE